METNKYRLKVFGKMSDKLMKEYLRKFRQIKQLPQNHEVLFCDRTSIDIPISYKFSKIKVDDSIIKVESICIISITQQLFRAFDCIPAGWQTICEFDFSPVIPSIILHLPRIEEWYDRKKVENVFF